MGSRRCRRKARCGRIGALCTLSLLLGLPTVYDQYVDSKPNLMVAQTYSCQNADSPQSHWEPCRCQSGAPSGYHYPMNLHFISHHTLVHKGLPLAALLVGALILTSLLSRVLNRQYSKSNPRVAARQRTLLHAVNSVLRYTIWAAAVLIAISFFNGNASGTFLSLGTFAVVAGFAVQHGVKDFLAGSFLLLEGQYAVGDNLYISPTIQGTVEKFDLRTTTIRLEDGRRAVIRHDALNMFVVTEAHLIALDNPAQLRTAGLAVKF